MGGSSTRAYNIAKGLVMNGAEVTVVAGFPHYPHGNVPRHLRSKVLIVEYMDGFRIIRTFVPSLPAKGITKRIILFASFIASSLFPLLIIRERIDAVFASNPQILAILPAFVYSLLHRCPIILNVDDLWPEDPIDIGAIKSRFMYKVGELLARIAYHKAHLITPISPGYIAIIHGKYRVPRSKIHVIRGGVDMDKFKQTTLIREDEKFVVLYSGAFSVAYDFDQVLMAAKLLKDHNDVKIVLQGGGELLNDVKSKVEEMDLRNVKILDKILSREEVAKLLGEADALLLPLKDFGRPYLGISSKLYEYQAAGKPIICCAEGQPAEYVSETGSGIVVKPGDYEALAKAILYLKENLDVAEKLGACGRQYVENNLSIEKIGSKMVAVLTICMRKKII